MGWTGIDTWIVVAGALAAVACALPGNFLILRRMSMMGDAISHAVLPGLAIAFLLTNSRGSMAMFVGAAIVGVLTAVLTQWIHSLGRVETSAAMGVVFTVLFAAGLILIVRAADHVDLDPGCVLYGAIELVPLDTVDWGFVEPPLAVVTLAGMLAVDLLFIVLFYKELRISAFDPQLSTTLGINAGLMHYATMVMVAATSVAAFESVGSILVIAMLIVPGATARMLTDRLGVMLVLSAVVAVLCAVLGHVAAITVPTWFGFGATNTAGMMAVVAGVVFAAAVVGAPRHGVLVRYGHRLALSLRVVQEDVLGLLYRLEEVRGPAHPGAPAAVLDQALVASRGLTRLAVWALARQRRVLRTPAGHYQLTDLGRHDARGLVRAHRLWETYLVKHLHLPLDHVHAPATVLEHVTDPAMQRKLADRTGQPEHDPQGKAIPPSQA